MALELIDAGVALDLLAESVRRHGGRTTGSADGGIVAVALSIGGLAPQDVAPFRDHEVRTLWARGELPCAMTLGGVLVLGRAQRAQRAGASWAVAAAHAARAARSLVGLVPITPCASSMETSDERPSTNSEAV